MKKNVKTRKCREGFDMETLRVWKNSSTKARLEWLTSAFRFGKLRKF